MAVMKDEANKHFGSFDSLPKAAQGVELIQQWQYIGKVQPELLEDEAFDYAKRVGLTSLQSYVYWAEIEKEPGKIDFSSYDVLVEKLIKHNLKWVPFLILGPYYATPKWFQESGESVYAKCLEHGKESKVQSIWNPHLPKYVDRFLQLVAEHYRDSGVLESIELGISGNWGESLYPSLGGFYPDFHTHPGWWCGDDYATSSFRQFAIERHKSLPALNAACGTQFGSSEEVSFPPIKQPWLNLAYRVFGIAPRWAKPWLSMAWEKGLAGLLNRLCSLRCKADPGGQQRWLDFVSWYLGSMTDWVEFWIKTARKHFPNTEIYLVTGGDGKPKLGADFSAQAKVAAKYNAGIRITNQTDDYAHSFSLTRLVSSAARFYGTYFTTEEGGINLPQGVTMRLFDAATSGAKGFYCKSIIGTGTDICTGRTSPLGKPTQGALNLAQNIHHLRLSQPIIDVAVLFPNTSIALDPSALISVYSQCSQLRDMVDFDLVDENMVIDGALKKYRFLVALDGNQLRRQTIMEVENWVKEGGILIATRDTGLSTINDNGKGYSLLLTGKERNLLKFISQAIYNEKDTYPWVGIPEIDGEQDRVFATRFADRILYYNSTNSALRKRGSLNKLSRGKTFDINMKPQSIVAVDLDLRKVLQEEKAG